MAGRLGEVMRTCLVSVEDTEDAEDTTAISSISLSDESSARVQQELAIFEESACAFLSHEFVKMYCISSIESFGNGMGLWVDSRVQRF